MNAKGIEVFIQEEYYSNSVLVWVRDRSPHGEDNISFDGVNLVYTRIDPNVLAGDVVSPFMKLPMEFSFALFKAIFEYQSSKGIKTIDENLLAGKMEATERHLADMREISKKLLDSTLNTK